MRSSGMIAIREVLPAAPSTTSIVLHQASCCASLISPRVSTCNGSESTAELRFAVRDSEMGIPADKQREIFQAFSQADDSMTRAHGGTGLGLAISSQLVRLFGGELAVDNAIGSGSTFWFAIWLPVGTKATFNTARPLKGAHQPRVIATPSSPVGSTTATPAPLTVGDPVLREASEQHRAAARAPIDERKDSAPILEVLLVEDNAVNAMVAKGMLASLGVDVITAGNGEEAVALCRQRHFALVLMDGQMPVMDGLEATRMIREHEAGSGRHQTIIALTAHAFTDYQDSCSRSGMDDFLSKPLTKRALAAVLEKWSLHSAPITTPSDVTVG